MNENSNEQNKPRTQRTHDLVSGEELLVVYFPNAGVVTVNGYSVTRSPELEDKASQAVFRRPLGNMVFTVETGILSRLLL
jgi:hypothetical protein